MFMFAMCILTTKRIRESRGAKMGLAFLFARQQKKSTSESANERSDL